MNERRARHTLLLTLLVAATSTLASAEQKRLLDQGSPPDWPTIDNEQISPDGRYVLYDEATRQSGRKTYLKATNTPQRKVLPTSVEIGAVGAAFALGGQRVVFRSNANDLGVWDVGRDRLETIAGVVKYTIPPQSSGMWLAYALAPPTRELVLLAADGRKRSYASISTFDFSPDGKVLLLTRDDPRQAGDLQLMWVDMDDGQERKIDSIRGLGAWAFDAAEGCVVYVARNEQGLTELHYYRRGMSRAEILLEARPAELNGWDVTGSLRWSRSQDQLTFEIAPPRQTARKVTPKEGVRVEIRYSREDAGFGTEPRSGVAGISVDSGSRPRQLTQTGDYVDERSQDWLLMRRPAHKLSASGIRLGLDTYSSWDYDCISVMSGSRRPVVRNLGGVGTRHGPRFSPAGKYLVWYDPHAQTWMTYDVEHGRVNNVSRGIPAPLVAEHVSTAGPVWPYDIQGWIENDGALLIKDRHDLWQLDPSGARAPINVTAGYGAIHDVAFAAMVPDGESSSFKVGQRLKLAVIDRSNQSNGFAAVTLGQSKAPKLLTLQPAQLYWYGLGGEVLEGARGTSLPVKAKDASIYLLRRQSESEFPNLYVTRDFRKFEAVTALAPQRDYFWYATELHRWRSSAGDGAEGILFKPENFDATKKYPLIVYIYQSTGDSLHAFLSPTASRGPLNVTWYVNHGYLVFYPSLVRHEVGRPLQSACEEIGAALEHLGRLPYVDMKHLGLQGHSYGGAEVNYIVSRLDSFAAAAPASGASDIVSMYAQEEPGTYHYYERGQGNMGATLWQQPRLYHEESAVLRADHVSTPLLIEHTLGDTAVPAFQAYEWYYSLSRLGKDAWLLMYPRENHVLQDESDQLDYATRLGQFFDHYLKGLPAPEWMRIDQTQKQALR